MSDAARLLSARDLVKTYPGRRGHSGHRALDGVAFDLFAGETLGVVGESGSGKSTLARILVRLAGVDSGSVDFEGIDLLRPDPAQARHLTRQIQIVFQDPNSTMNPRRTVCQALLEAARVREDGSGVTRSELTEMLLTVGLSGDKLDAYPHQLSGGQRQRVAIARALAVSPRVVVADECVSALDVSVQSAILNLMLDLQRKLGLSYIFISHDIAVVRHMSDRIMVMQSGKVVENGPVEQVIERPSHPYTMALLDSVSFHGNRDWGKAS